MPLSRHGEADMDCLTYRRIKLATPQDASPEAIAHARACDNCAAFTRQLEAFEQDLHATLHVPVSEGLSDKIILRRGRPRWFRAAWLPVAAAIVITLTALVVFNTLPSHDSLAQEFINHVLSEPRALGKDPHVEKNALRKVFAEFGGQLKSDVGDVNYLNRCRIAGVDSTHVQVSTRSGDADLLLRPGHRISIDTPAVHQGHAVVVIAVPQGSLAIVAATPQQASDIRSLLLSSADFHG